MLTTESWPRWSAVAARMALSGPGPGLCRDWDDGQQDTAGPGRTQELLGAAGGGV